MKIPTAPINYFIFTLILLIALPLGAATSEAFREFKSLDGKTIHARIISGNQKTIKIKLKDGRTFDIKVFQFSPDDREYIKKWVDEYALNNLNLVITARGGRGKTKTTSGNIRIKKTPAFYKVTIANKSYVDVEGLTVKYIAYKSTDVVASTSSSDKKRHQNSGLHTISKIGKRTEVQFETKAVILTATKLDNKFSGFTNGGDKRSSESLRGIWIRVYKGDKLVSEYASPSSLKTQKWFFSVETDKKKK